MPHEARSEVEGLFYRLLDLPPQERRRILDCEGVKPGIRSEVEELLELDARDDDGFLRPVRLHSDGGESGLEASIGPYELLEEIGEGGFAVVYLARQRHPVERLVALKVLKPGMDTRRVVARFESERQTLAKMEHPGIAGFYDAGSTPRGRPFLVMEYVPGAPITEYVSSARLSTMDKLELFLQVCDVIQHAHQKGIVHRDIKPSNVLVRDMDGKPLVKVIDFGVARVLDSAQDQPALTREGQLLGTPEYMAPEQVSPTGSGADTRTDVFSLGVLLYELLTGASAFRVEWPDGDGVPEIVRRILTMDPPRPSSRAVARPRARSGPDPALLRRQLRGDLDWITMKAMAKEPDRRYASAWELRADLERHLRSVPVLAGPPRFGYVLHKFVRRHRVFALAGLLSLAALVAGTGVATWQAIRADSNARLAIRKGAEARRQAYVANISAASAALQGDDVSFARQCLERVPQEERGWEWRHFWNCLDDSRVVLKGHTSGIDLLRFNSDGSRLTTGSTDGTTRLWDVATGRELSVHDRSLDSPSDGNSRSDTGSSLGRVEIPEGLDIPPEISPGGRRVAFCTADHAAGVYRVLVADRASGKIECEWTGHDEQVQDITFSPDGKFLATSSRDATARIWSLETGEEVQVLRGHSGEVSVVNWSPDGALVATGGHDRTLRMWDARSGNEVVRLHGHTDEVEDVIFSPDGRCLASCAHDRTARLWDFSLTSRRRIVDLHGTYVYAVAVSPDGSRIASGGWDNIVRVSVAGTTREVAVLQGHSEHVMTVDFSSDGKLLATVAADRTVRVWEVATEKEVAKFTAYDPYEQGAALFTRNGRGIFVGWDLKAGVRFWDPLTDRVETEPLHTLRDSGLPLVSPDGSVAVLRLPVSRTTVQTHFRLPLAVVDLESGDRLIELEAGFPGSVAFSPAGRYLAIPLRGRNVSVLNVTTLEEVALLTSHSGPVYDLEFSPDGSRLATASRDRTIRLWDPSTFEELAQLRGHTDYVFALDFSPDGSMLISGSGDHTVRIWDTMPRQR